MSVGVLQDNLVFLYIKNTNHNSSISSDEGLTLETEASKSVYGSQFTETRVENRTPRAVFQFEEL